MRKTKPTTLDPSAEHAVFPRRRQHVVDPLAQVRAVGPLARPVPRCTLPLSGRGGIWRLRLAPLRIADGEVFQCLCQRVIPIRPRWLTHPTDDLGGSSWIAHEIATACPA